MSLLSLTFWNLSFEFVFFDVQIQWKLAVAVGKVTDGSHTKYQVQYNLEVLVGLKYVYLCITICFIAPFVSLVSEVSSFDIV